MSDSATLFIRKSLLWVGLLLMSGAVALTALLWFLFVVSVPVFLVGFGQVLVSGQRWWRIGLALAFPLLAWVGVAAGAWALAPREQPLTYLVPAGFGGTFLVVKNERCGVLPTLEDGRSVYRVPASGLLITRGTVPHRAHPYYAWPHRSYFLQPNNRYYLVDRQGRRRELTEVYAATDSTSGPAATSALRNVGRDELAAFSDPPSEGTINPAGGINYAFQYVTVTTQNRLDRPERLDNSPRLRALADSLLPRCRASAGPPP